MIRESDSPGLRHAGLVQLQPIEGNPAANLRRLEKILTELAPPAHSLIVLPELWATGFAYRQLPQLREHVAALAGRLQALAERFDILLAGSLPEETAEPGKFFNTLTIIGRGGSYGSYRKCHVFPGEEQAFKSSLQASPPIATPEGRFGSLICYDLRFPELARRQCQQGADLLMCSAEWPATRIDHWRILVMARAIENQTFVVACNGVGRNGDITLGGHSLIVSPAGEILYEAGDDEEAKIVPMDWRAKQQAQSVFRSFTATPYRIAAEKIASPRHIVAEAELRAGIGQRVIYAAVDDRLDVRRRIELLETARQWGDYLVVGVRISGAEGDPPPAENDRRILLLPYAAIGCVDAAFDLDAISPSMLQRLVAVCRTFS